MQFVAYMRQQFGTLPNIFLGTWMLCLNKHVDNFFNLETSKTAKAQPVPFQHDWLASIDKRKFLHVFTCLACPAFGHIEMFSSNEFVNMN